MRTLFLQLIQQHRPNKINEKKINTFNEKFPVTLINTKCNINFWFDFCFGLETSTHESLFYRFRSKYVRPPHTHTHTLITLIQYCFIRQPSSILHFVCVRWKVPFPLKNKTMSKQTDKIKRKQQQRKRSYHYGEMHNLQILSGLPSSLAAIQYLSVHSCSRMKVDIVSLESDGGVYAVKRYFVEN